MILAKRGLVLQGDGKGEGNADMKVEEADS